MKKLFRLFSILIILSVFFVFGLGINAQTVTIEPQNQNAGANDKLPEYTLLAPLTNFKVFNSNSSCPLGDYLGPMLGIFIGITAVLSMVMIVLGGLEYMTSGVISEKAAGKEKIQNAILGLVLALGAWLILNTINPELLDVCLNLPAGGIK